MRLIPGNTKVKIELFRGVGIGDIIVGVIGVGLMTLMLLSTIPYKIYIAIGIVVLTGGLIFRLDDEPTYMLILHFLKFRSYPKRFARVFSDKTLLSKGRGTQMQDYLDNYGPKEEDPLDELSPKEKRKALKALIKEENKILKSKKSTDEEKNAVWLARAKRSEEKKRERQEAKHSFRDEKNLEDIIAFTGIKDGFIEYGGKYYGTVIEVDPVEFRFFSRYRRNSAIE
ncbi:MAG: hypothetical protein J6N76_05125, partial [Lachnospiraceae bacterium]|nr:hypothetical protein [Lachnospiraceae bacterium]